MQISSSGNIMPSDVARTYAAQTYSAAPVQKEELARRFDSVTISGENGKSSFEMELRSKLAQEVRTATSSGKLSALREEVQSGAYWPDPMAIARKMLLFGEAG